MKCEAVNCKHNQLENFLYGYCQKKHPKLETEQDPVTYEEIKTGRCFDYEKRIKGEYFADYDQETGLFCVFHTDFKTGHSFSSYTTLAEAGRDAEERNNK